MIEPIQSHAMYFMLIGFVIAISSLVIVMSGKFENSRKEIPIFFTILIIGGCIMFFGIFDMYNSSSLLEEQISGLECEQYEEAYNVYEVKKNKEIIRELYVKNCTDVEWWKR